MIFSNSLNITRRGDSWYLGNLKISFVVFIPNTPKNNAIPYTYSTLNKINGFWLDESSRINPKLYSPDTKTWRFRNEREVCQRHPKSTTGHPKISEVDPKPTQSIPNSSEVDPKSSEDFRSRPEEFRKCPMFNLSLSRISDVGPKSFKGFWSKNEQRGLKVYCYHVLIGWSKFCWV